MAMQSLYEVLKEKETQLQELQRLLTEAQTVLSRVLELNAAASGSTGSTRPDAPGSNGTRQVSDPSPRRLGAISSTEFP